MAAVRESTVVQLAGLILISAACPVISALSGSLETLLLAHAASVLSGMFLFCEGRAGRKLGRQTSGQNFHQLPVWQMERWQVIDAFSLFCVAAALALLTGLAGSTSLEMIQTTLRESYRPDRAELIVGDGSILGVASVVLLFVGCAAQFGLFPLHGLLMNEFESSPAGIVGVTAVFQRLQVSILLYRVIIAGMPGFESTVQLMCAVFGITSCLCGAILACRSESLRCLAGNFWMTWGGVALVAVATGLATETSAVAGASWQLPDGVENAAFTLFISSVAIAMLLTCDRRLTGEKRGVDFFEDLTGLGKQHRFVALAVGCSLLTLCAIPPLPGFWSVTFVVCAAFLPGAESIQGPSLVPDTLILVSAAIVLVAMMILAARSVSLLSLMMHHEPVRRFRIRSTRTSPSVSLFFVSLLLWTGVSAGTVLFWIHRWFL